jgi:hypothetical protein
VVPFVLAGSQNAVASERHCTYTDDPAVYECGYDEPLRTQAELETEMAERRAAGAQAVRARAASAQAVAAALSPEAAIAQLLVPVDDVSALSAEALAIGLAMSADFPRYAEVVTSAVEAPATPEPSRLMLLEILSGNWQFPEAREAVEHVFATAPPSSASAAYAALALAEQGEDIAAELLDRYPGLAPAQRGVYLRALAATGSSDAVPFILQRLSATDDADALERTVAAEMLGELASADDADASSALMSTIATYGALEAGSTGPVPDDAVAMRAARALGRIGGAENIGLLLGVAADTDLTTDTRITALEALSDHTSGDGPLAERLQRVAKGFAASGRGQSDRERFESMVERVLQ